MITPEDRDGLKLIFWGVLAGATALGLSILMFLAGWTWLLHLGVIR